LDLEVAQELAGIFFFLLDDIELLLLQSLDEAGGFGKLLLQLLNALLRDLEALLRGLYLLVLHLKSAFELRSHRLVLWGTWLGVLLLQFRDTGLGFNQLIRCLVEPLLNELRFVLVLAQSHDAFAKTLHFLFHLADYFILFIES